MVRSSAPSESSRSGDPYTDAPREEGTMQISVFQGAGCFSPPQSAAVDTQALATAGSTATVARLEALAARVMAGPPPPPVGYSTQPGVTITIAGAGRPFSRTYPGGTATQEVQALAAAVFALQRHSPGDIAL